MRVKAKTILAGFLIVMLGAAVGLTSTEGATAPLYGSGDPQPGCRPNQICPDGSQSPICVPGKICTVKK
jgi:hypothetical protein